MGSLGDRVGQARVALLDALYAFYLERERCGDLDSGLDGDRVWMTCTAARRSIGARMMIDERDRLQRFAVVC